MTRFLNTLVATLVLAVTCMTSSAADCGCASETYAADASCDCQEPCCVDPCICCKAKMKVAKKATSVCDPDCYKCCPETNKEDVEKHCYNVCAEPVCIPKFRWPWECCCSVPKCGKIRCVNVLEKEKYKCEECVTTWKAVRKGYGGCRCNHGCDDGCCAATEKPADVLTVSAEEPVAVEEAEEASKQTSAVAKFSKWFHR